MARDPNWKPEDGPDARESMRTATSSRLRSIPGVGQVLNATDAATDTIGSGLRAASRYGARAAERAPVPERPTPLLPGVEWNQPARNVPSAMDVPDDPTSGIAGVFSGRNGLRVVSREEADRPQPAAAPAEIDTTDTMDYAGVANRARQGIRGATLAARGDAANLLNPASNEAEIMRRAQHATGSYFNKGFTGARNAQVSALLGQLEAGNEVSRAGAEQEGGAELLAADNQFQSNTADRAQRGAAKYGLRGAGANGGDIGDMIDLMQLDETRRANTTREGEAARGRTQERMDSLFGDPTENPSALDKSNPTHRALAAFLVQSEEDPDYAKSEEGMQTERRIFNELTTQLDANKTLFSPETGAGTQVSGPASRLKGLRVDPNDDVGYRNLIPDPLQRALGMTPGSVQYTTESGDTAAAPLDNVPLGQNPVLQQFLREASARYSTE